MYVFIYFKERDEARKLYDGKKIKKSNDNKPKTFVPGEQLDKLTLSSQSGTQGGFGGPPESIGQQQRVERVQPSKEDLDAIRVSSYKMMMTMKPFKLLNIYSYLF